MKKFVHKLLVVLLCAVLLCSVLGTASGSSGVYFMAVNDTVVEMTSENMPILVGGTLYVPYIMLSPRHNNGINLGVVAQYSTTRRTVLVASGQKGVIFNPQDNTCYDLNDNPLSARAVVRNSMVYIPLAWVCDYFGSISYTTTRTAYGTLIRVTNSAVILTDAEFVDAANNMLRENYRNYLSSLTNPEDNPVDNSPEPSVQPTNGPVVYLAFRMGEQAEEMAQLLENNVQRGLFLFTVEQLSQQDDMVRRLIGAGHMVGLEVQGSTLEECTAQIEEGRRLLADVARSALTIVSAPDAGKQVRQSLMEQGFALWRATVQAEETSTAGKLLRALDSDEPNYVECACDQSALSLMANAMRFLTGDDYRLRQAVAPVL